MTREWLKDARPPSFRGVPFEVDRHDLGGGRRGVLHQFRDRDIPYFEDAGRQARSFTVQAYVIGPGYFDKRDALQDALETEGPGPLIHPYLGSFSAVSVQTFRLSEDIGRGNTANFTIEFVEAGENLFPAATTDRRLAVEGAGDNSIDAALADFDDVFSVDNEPAAAFEDALARTEDFLDDLLDQAKRIRSEEAAGWDLILRINGIISDAGTLIRTPFDLATQMADRARGFARLLPAGRAALRPLLDLADWGDDQIIPTALSNSAARRETNTRALIDLVRRVYVTEAALKITEGGFETLDQALAARDQIVAAIDVALISAGNVGGPAPFVALTNLRAETVRWISEEAARLPRLRGWTPRVTLPAALIAYRLYDDSTRAGEIASRNRIAHPGFVPGGTEIQVLDT